jgi:hypothetical protein
VRSRTALNPFFTYPVYDFSTQQFLECLRALSVTNSAPAVLPSRMASNERRLALLKDLADVLHRAARNVQVVSRGHLRECANLRLSMETST